jgi:large subunit ribosomal protein L23
MALFGKKQNSEKKVEKASSGQASVSVASYAHILKSPRITEKASMHSAESVYTFDVATFATKPQIARAIREVYKVTPRMVRVVTIRPKATRNMRTGKSGMRSGGKKAYVYLKKGETITVV